MKYAILLSIFLFAVGFGLVNGLNNSMPIVCVGILLFVYIVVPAYYKLKYFINKFFVVNPNKGWTVIG